ncbi:MAG: hypothetical protein ACYST2_00505 [Planctomycetota bacterium]|jgi:hypothetical protein
MGCSQERHERIKRLVHVLNKARKRQAKKIDILCNDFISTQRSFIKKLEIIAFAADFYESIMGTTDLQALLEKANRHVLNAADNSHITFFFRNESGFEKHIFDSSDENASENLELREAITDEVATNICTLNKICTVDDLLTMGLQCSPNILNKMTVVTIPLGKMGCSIGFILLYRNGKNSISSSEINNICSITSGLSQAITSCKMLQH